MPTHYIEASMTATLAPENLITLPVAARRIGIRPVSVRGLMERKRLKAAGFVQYGNRRVWLFDPADVDAYRDERSRTYHRVVSNSMVYLPDQDMVTMEQVATALKTEPKNIRYHVKRGHLPHPDGVGMNALFERDTVVRWLATLGVRVEVPARLDNTTTT